jgi:hypothetical protein
MELKTSEQLSFENPQDPEVQGNAILSMLKMLEIITIQLGTIIDQQRYMLNIAEGGRQTDYSPHNLTTPIDRADEVTPQQQAIRDEAFETSLQGQLEADVAGDGPPTQEEDDAEPEGEEVEEDAAEPEAEVEGEGSEVEEVAADEGGEESPKGVAS